MGMVREESETSTSPGGRIRSRKDKSRSSRLSILFRAQEHGQERWLEESEVVLSGEQASAGKAGWGGPSAL